METILNSVQIQEILLHRYPFLLLDKIVELEGEERIVGIKNVTINEEFFMGHFPGRPVMPGVLILEAMAQVAAIMARNVMPKDAAVMIVAADKIRWKKQVVPGDTMRIEMRSVRKRRPLWVLEGEVTVDGKVVASGQISAMEVA